MGLYRDYIGIIQGLYWGYIGIIRGLIYPPRVRSSIDLLRRWNLGVGHGRKGGSRETHECLMGTGSAACKLASQACASCALPGRELAASKLCNVNP